MKARSATLRARVLGLVLAGWLGLTGNSVALPDLRVTLTDSPDPVSIGELLTYHVSITNQGDVTATGVTLTNILSPTVTFFSASVSQGTFAQIGSLVTGDLGAINAGNAATLRLTVTPGTVGTITNLATVSLNQVDSNPANNAATQSSLVVPLTFYPGPNLNIGRSYHTATLLADGRVLIVGGLTSTGRTATAELYNPQTKTFTLTGSMLDGRSAHAATRLNDGTVLITGASTRDWPYAELYNPTNSQFSAVGNVNLPHVHHTSTLLTNGTVLIAGSWYWPENGAEIYLPATRSFTNTGSMKSGGYFHRAILLDEGNVLVAGGNVWGSGGWADLYDPVAGSFTALGPLTYWRHWCGVEKLADGQVLLASGNTADVYAPATRTFVTLTNRMHAQHGFATAHRLPDGKVLVAGSSSMAELFDPASASFQRTAEMQVARNYFTATPLPDGTILFVGGESAASGAQLASTEIYDPARTKAPPAVSIAGTTLAEGDTGTTNVVFPVTLSAPMGVPVSVNFATASGSAANNSDFAPTNGVLVFPPGVTNLSIEIPVMSDVDYETDESFSIALSSPTNAVIDAGAAAGLILNDDVQPTISVAPVAQPEGNAYTNVMTFTAALSGASHETISVSYFTSNGTAAAGADYSPTNGTLTFAPGTTDLPVVVVLKSDIAVESDETFALLLTNALNATLTTRSVTATILNDDGLPGVIEHFELSTVASPQHVQLPFPLTITAKDAFGQTVTNFAGGVTLWSAVTNVPDGFYDFSEGDLSQWTPLNPGGSPGPYEIVPFDVSGHGCPSLAFRLLPDWNAPDGISRPINLFAGQTCAISADFASYNDNGTYVNLYPGAVAILLNGQVLTNFDFGSLGYIGVYQTFRTNLTALYTAPSNGTYLLTLRSTRPVVQQQVWHYADNVRVAPACVPGGWLADFINGVWTGNLLPGTVATGVTLNVESPFGYRGSGNPFDVTPTSDLGLAGVRTPALVRAGSDVTFSFTLTNRGPSTAPDVVVSNVLGADLRFRSATASQGTNAGFGNTVVYNLGSLTNRQQITLAVTAKPYLPGPVTNVAAVACDAFDTNLLDNAIEFAMTAEVPLILGDNVSLTELDVGTNFVSVPIRLEGPVGMALSLDYATTNGSALAGSDYLAVSGTLVFPPDVTTQFVTIPIRGDLTDEPNETFTLLLSNPTNATLSASQVTVTILDNDPLPAVSIADAAVVEGNGGTNMIFAMTLSNPSGSEVRVTCTTSNGTALSGNDYASTTTTVIFPAGSTNQNFAVTVFGDSNNEPDQSFTVNLSAPVNCSLARSSATGTIVNDDDAPGKLLLFGFDPIASPQYRGRGFPVTVRALDHLSQPASFSGTVTLAAQTDGYYVRRLWDDFEDGDLAGWTNFGTASLIVSIVNDVAANGSRSLRLSGKASNPFYSYSLRYTITNSRPNKVSFYVRSAQTNAISGRIWAVGGAGYRAFDFYMNKDGRMGLYNNSTALATTPYTSNRWYRVDMDLTWGSLFSTRKVSCSIDGVVLTNNLNFLDDTYSGIDWIAVQNTETATAWFDDIHVCESFYTNLVVAPTTLSGFSSGVWTGNVTVSQSASNVYFTVTDNNDHTGQSTNFDVLTAALQLITPAAITEGNPPVAAEVRIPLAFPQALTIYLTSSVPADLTVPTSVTIPGGQTNATFNLTVVDDAVLDGSQLVTVSAGNTNLISASAVVSVDDNEVAVLTLTVPTNVTENAGVLAGQGRVTASAPLAKAATITLTSGDTNVVQVPASVVIASNQSFVNFNVTIVDDTRIDGPQSATISAAAANWTGDSQRITVTDDETTNLRISVPAFVNEGGSATVSVHLTGSLNTNVTIDLSSSDTNALATPPAGMVPAGLTSAVFSVTAPDNAFFDGTRVVTLAAIAPGFTSAITNVSVTDNELHHFDFSAIASPQQGGVGFILTLTARDINNTLMASYSTNVTLSAVDGFSNPVPLTPATVGLVNGQWTGTVTVPGWEFQNARVIATSGGVSNASSLFDVVAPTLSVVNVTGSDLAYSPLNGRLYVNNTSGFLTPINTWQSQVESSVNIGGLGARMVASDNGQFLFLERTNGNLCRFNVASNIADLFWSSGAPQIEDMAVVPGWPTAVAVSRMDTSTSPRTRGTVVYHNGVALPNGGGGNVIEFASSLPRLYTYNNEGGCGVTMYDVNTNGLTPVTGFSWSCYSGNFVGRGGLLFMGSGEILHSERFILVGSHSSGTAVGGDETEGRCYLWQYGGSQSSIVARDLHTLLPIGSTDLPAVTSAAASLIRWGTNGLAFRINGSQIAIVRSQWVPSGQDCDLVLSRLSASGPVLVGDNFTCTYAISNAGPGRATNVVLTATLPATASLVAIGSTNGPCTAVSGGVVCNIPSLAAGATAQVTVTLSPTKPGPMAFKVGVLSGAPDPNLMNNRLSIDVPALFVGGYDSVVELALPANDLAYDPAHGKICASVPNGNELLGNSIVTFDPLSGYYPSLIPTAVEPGKLAVADNGQYLYTSISTETAIQRINLNTRVADLKFPTGYGGVNDMEVMPGNAAVVAATVHTTVVVYENGVPRPNVVGPTEYNHPYSLEFGASSNRLYASFPWGSRRINVDTNGASLIEDVRDTLIVGYTYDMDFGSGLIYAINGRVFNPETKTMVATLPYSGLVIAGPLSGYAYFLTSSGSTATLHVIDMPTRAEIKSITISGISGSAASFIRWGNDGFAFRTTGGQLFLIRNTYADDRDNDTLPDSWELQYFPSINSLGSGPTDDPDGDGMTNFQEWRAGLNPVVFDAVRFLAQRRLASGAMELTVLGRLGQRYALFASTNLTDWLPIQNFACTNLPLLLLDGAATNWGARFYRFGPQAAIPRPSLAFGSPALASNGVNLLLDGFAGIAYRLERSSNLNDWQVVTNFVSTNALMPVRDPVAPNESQRFYRALIP